MSPREQQKCRLLQAAACNAAICSHRVLCLLLSKTPPRGVSTLGTWSGIVSSLEIGRLYESDVRMKPEMILSLLQRHTAPHPVSVKIRFANVYCKSTIYFRQHNNIDIFIYFNITYIIILATCFESYESSSDINFQELLYILYYRQKNCKT